MRQPRRLSNRVCHCCFSVLDHSLNLQSNPAVIVRHRIVEPWLDDELAALNDSRHRFPRRRPCAWCKANAMIAKFTCPHANMPQDALNDLRVIDQSHDAHLVMTLGCHRDKAADQQKNWDGQEPDRGPHRAAGEFAASD